MSDEIKSESNIVKLLDDVQTFKLKEGCSKSKFTNPCRSNCRNVEVDTDNRTIECRECKRVLDPFDYLADWSKKTEYRLEYLTQLEIDEKKRRAMIATLDNELRKMKKVLKAAEPEHPFLKDYFALERASEIKIIQGGLK